MDYNFDSSYLIDHFGYRRYNELGQREMVFFYPFIKYDTRNYMNDLSLLDDIGNDKYMEMALSFDREYTLDEVGKVIPEGVMVTWYWVDDLNKNEKEMSKSHNEEQEGIEVTIHIPDSVRSEYTAYGIKLYYGTGEKIPDPVEFFINSLKSYKEDRAINKNFYKNEFDRIYNNIAGDDGKLTRNDIRIWGAVVTGDSDNLKVLIGLPFIKASSLGVVTDKY